MTMAGIQKLMLLVLEAARESSYDSAFWVDRKGGLHLEVWVSQR